MKIFWAGLVSICILAAALIWGGRLWDAWQWNQDALALLQDKEASVPLANPDCAQIWFLGMIAGQRGDLAAQRQALERALSCSPEYVSLIQAVIPQDLKLAGLATQLQPESAAAWFWLGEASAPTDASVARQAYERTVALAPYRGLPWCRLGFNYEHTGELERAERAFLNCCLNGDPGSNGCYGAGRMLEQMGDPQQAIIYYRRSRWQGSLDRARELESSLNP